MQYTNNYLYSNLQLSSNYFVAYPVFERETYKSNKSSFRKFSAINHKQNYKGEINQKSKSKIISAVNLLFDISSRQYFINKYTGKRNYFKINFITLTLSSSQMLIEDRIIKKECLEWWLSYARRKFNLKHYVWKAERQKNGNLHFHLTTNCFIDVDKLRESWNLAQNRIGFIDLFNLKHNHHNPNSTDIKIVNSKNAIGSYIAKYIGKELEKNNKISGKVWDCSQSLKNVKKPTIEINQSIEKEILEVLKLNDHKIIIKEPITIYAFNNSKVKNIIKGEIKNCYYEYIREVKSYQPNSKNVKSIMERRKPRKEKSALDEIKFVKSKVENTKRLLPKEREELFTKLTLTCFQRKKNIIICND